MSYIQVSIKRDQGAHNQEVYVGNRHLFGHNISQVPHYTQQSTSDAPLFLARTNVDTARFVQQ